MALAALCLDVKFRIVRHKLRYADWRFHEDETMRFILGVFVGAALMLGSAYLHDTGAVRVGPSQPFVNWDTLIGAIGR